jgi:hypothetical protein
MQALKRFPEASGCLNGESAARPHSSLLFVAGGKTPPVWPATP